jgi:hypothetical protein
MVYDPKIDNWSIRGLAPTYGAGEDAAVTNGVGSPKRIYVFEREATYIHDPYTDSWTQGAPRPANQYNVKVAVVNYAFFVLGGSTTEQTFPTYKGTVYSTNQAYTPFLFGTVPSLSILSPQNISYTSDDVFLNFTVKQATSWLGYSLDGRNNVTITGDCKLAGLNEGRHNLVIYARNFAGDITSLATASFGIDYTSPSIHILSPENKTYQGDSVALTFVINELAEISYCLDGQQTFTITGNSTLSELSMGLHNLTVYANDASGNIGNSETISFSVTESSWWLSIIAVSVALAVVVALVAFAYLKKRRC